jgi:hypothetical protein
MIESIKNLLFNRQFVKVGHVDRIPLSSKVNSLLSITLLVDGSRHVVNEMTEAMLYFNKMGIDCDAFLVVPDTAQSEDNRVNLISKDDCHWYDIPKQEMIIKWLQHKTDLLIVLNPSNSRVIKYLSATSNSLLKTAVIYNEMWDNNFDFCLDVSKGKKTTVKAVSSALYSELLKIHQPVRV